MVGVSRISLSPRRLAGALVSESNGLDAIRQHNRFMNDLSAFAIASKWPARHPVINGAFNFSAWAVKEQLRIKA